MGTRLMGLCLRWALTPHLPRLPAGSLESTEHTYVYKVQGSGGTPPQTPTGTRTKQRLPGTSVPMPELTATEERCSYFPGASHNAFMTCIPLSSWFFNQFYFSPSKSSSPCPWASQVALVVENPLANAGDLKTWVRSLGQEGPLGEGMTTHSSVLTWEMPRTEEPGGLQSMGSPS